MDAFALDITGPWHAQVPRKGGERVFFKLELSRGDDGGYTGQGQQLHGGSSWSMTATGQLQEDQLTLELHFGQTLGAASDTERWIGVVEGDVVKVSYERNGWQSGRFALRRGWGDPADAATTPPSASAAIVDAAETLNFSTLDEKVTKKSSACVVS